MKATFFSLFLAFAFCIPNLSGQIDVKVNPFGILFNSPDVSAEYIANEQIGIELLAGVDYGTLLGSSSLSESNRLNKSGYRFRIAGKYYFEKDKGGDTWYAGIYAGANSRTATPSVNASSAIGWSESGINTGIHGGYKFVLNSNIIFDLGMGFGRIFSERLSFIDPVSGTFLSSFGLNSFLRLEMGYRF